ncbi:MAG: tripartite tricarboxylate transporter substrate binding protein [Burkholderiales bacterium]|nr:tripartite tricarboxylate transporter substrate binding protein [Burkholderiales bacterium]
MSTRGFTQCAARAALLAACVLGMAQSPARAAEYPSRPVRLIVPYAPGGGTDIIARIVAQDLSRMWGPSVIVDNRAGAAGMLGMQLAASSTADGHTVVLNSLGLSYPPALMAKPPYDVEKDFVPLTMVAIQPFIFVVLPSLGVSSMKELIALAKSKPGYIRYGSGGPGGASHLGTELLRGMAKIELTHVPYKGTGPALTAMLAGEIHVQLIGISSVVPHMKSGRMRALAVSGGKRSAALPEVPTVAESGMPGYAYDVWYGMLFPAGTARPIVSQANADMNRVLGSAALRQRFETLGMEAVGGTPEEFAKAVREDVSRWVPLAKAAARAAQAR